MRLINESLGVTVLLMLCQGCSSTQPSASTQSVVSAEAIATGLVGTWRLDSVIEGGTEIVHRPLKPNLFLMRFFADGSCASWPIPKDEIGAAFNVDRNGVSWGRYELKDGILSLPGVEGGAKIDIKGDEFSYAGDEGERWLYHRISPDLQPGAMPASTQP